MKYMLPKKKEGKEKEREGKKEREEERGKKKKKYLRPSFAGPGRSFAGEITYDGAAVDPRLFRRRVRTAARLRPVAPRCGNISF